MLTEIHNYIAYYFNQVYFGIPEDIVSDRGWGSVTWVMESTPESISQDLLQHTKMAATEYRYQQNNFLSSPD